jgi:Fe-S oxidoreductase
LIHWWSRLASYMPELVNFLTQSPVLSASAKLLAGVAPERQIPRFAARTFKERFRQHHSNNNGQTEVLLWPDTFNNHFYPEVAEAAVEVLEAAGYHVQIPAVSLCCGRPLYDYGMLPTAKRLLRRVMRCLQPQLSAGTPIIVLEPSCASVAVIGMEHEISFLSKVGLELTMPELGCCGMAGSFGFEEGDRYDVSVRCGERNLFPVVRQADPETLIIADGFSCREQIRQGTEREAVHSAQVLQMALRQSSVAKFATPPEQLFVEHRNAEHAKARRKTASATVGVATVVALLWMLARRRAGL